MMMMMGGGMCIPPMMVPPGLHHMPYAPYPQMGMAMSMGNMGMGYGLGVGDINHHAVYRTVPTPPLPPPPNFMPVINGAIFPFDNGILPVRSFGPQVTYCLV
jgi:phytochrome-interacting factor 3